MRIGRVAFQRDKKNRPRGHFGDRADPATDKKSRPGLGLCGDESRRGARSDHVCRISPREAGLLGIKKAVRPEHKCRISPREAGAKLIKKDGPRLTESVSDKSLNKGLISEDRNARLLCFVQYPVLVQVVCMGFISGGSRFWFLQRAESFSPPATR